MQLERLLLIYEAYLTPIQREHIQKTHGVVVGSMMGSIQLANAARKEKSRRSKKK